MLRWALTGVTTLWHDLAQGWQTPDVGEKSVAGLLGGTVGERAARMAEWDIDRPVAEHLAAGQDAEMGRAVLALYRSAAQPVMAELGRDLAAAAQRPGLSILATDDHMVGSDHIRNRAAARAGARTETLNGLGHWWMVQDPARALTDFWASLPA